MSERRIRMIRGMVPVTAESVVELLRQLRQATTAREKALDTMRQRRMMSPLLEAKSEQAARELRERIGALLESETPRDAKERLGHVVDAAAADRQRFETLRTHERQLDQLRVELACAERNENITNGELLFLVDCYAAMQSNPDKPLPLEVTPTGFFRVDADAEEENRQLEIAEAAARG